MRKNLKVIPYVLSACLAFGGIANVPFVKNGAAVVQAEETEQLDPEFTYTGPDTITVDPGTILTKEDLLQYVDVGDYDGEIESFEFEVWSGELEVETTDEGYKPVGSGSCELYINYSETENYYGGREYLTDIDIDASGDADKETPVFKYTGPVEMEVDMGTAFTADDLKKYIDLGDYDGTISDVSLSAGADDDYAWVESEFDDDDERISSMPMVDGYYCISFDYSSTDKYAGGKCYLDEFKITLIDNRKDVTVEYTGPSEFTVKKGEEFKLDTLEAYLALPDDYDGTAYFYVETDYVPKDEDDYDTRYDLNYEPDLGIPVSITPKETLSFKMTYKGYDSQRYNDFECAFDLKLNVTEAEDGTTAAKDDTTAAKKDTTASTVNAKSVKITGASKSIAAGKKVKLTAAVTPKNVTKKGVTWKSSNKKYATVTASGLVKTKKAGAGKKVTIIAKSKDGKASAKYVISIKKGIVKKIKINGKATVKAGKKLKLKAAVTASKGAYKKLKWTSSNKKVATVNAKGVVKAKKGAKGKKVTITAKALDGSNKKATKKITIK